MLRSTGFGQLWRNAFVTRGSATVGRAVPCPPLVVAKGDQRSSHLGRRAEDCPPYQLDQIIAFGPLLPRHGAADWVNTPPVAEVYPSVLLLIPAYNEQDRIEPALRDYARFFRQNYQGKFQLVVVLNGCWDNTFGVVQQVGAEFPEVSALEFPAPDWQGGRADRGAASGPARRFDRLCGCGRRHRPARLSGFDPATPRRRIA